MEHQVDYRREPNSKQFTVFCTCGYQETTDAAKFPEGSVAEAERLRLAHLHSVGLQG